MENIINRIPVNRIAAIVTAKAMEHQSLFINKDHVFQSDIKPATRIINKQLIGSNGFIDLSGKRIGRFVVVGVSAERNVWVVRCDCGKYVERKTSVLKKFENNSSRAMCQFCDYHDQEIRGYRYRRG